MNCPNARLKPKAMIFSSSLPHSLQIMISWPIFSSNVICSRIYSRISSLTLITYIYVFSSKMKSERRNLIITFYSAWLWLILIKMAIYLNVTIFMIDFIEFLYLPSSIWLRRNENQRPSVENYFVNQLSRSVSGT